MSTELNLNDPFERAVFDIVRMNRKKRRDYALYSSESDGAEEAK